MRVPHLGPQCVHEPKCLHCMMDGRHTPTASSKFWWPTCALASFLGQLINCYSLLHGPPDLGAIMGGAELRHIQAQPNFRNIGSNQPKPETAISGWPKLSFFETVNRPFGIISAPGTSFSYWNISLKNKNERINFFSKNKILKHIFKNIFLKQSNQIFFIIFVLKKKT